jgi:hypothetical protein
MRGHEGPAGYGSIGHADGIAHRAQCPTFGTLIAYL